MYPPFTLSGTPATIDATSTTAPIALPTSTAPQVMVSNSNLGSVAYIAFGADNTVAATNSGAARSLMVAAGSSQMFTVPVGLTWAAAIYPATQTGSIQFARGYGE